MTDLPGTPHHLIYVPALFEGDGLVHYMLTSSFWEGKLGETFLGKPRCKNPRGRNKGLTIVEGPVTCLVCIRDA